jgi:hypothetical protein
MKPEPLRSILTVAAFLFAPASAALAESAQVSAPVILMDRGVDVDQLEKTYPSATELDKMFANYEAHSISAVRNPNGDDSFEVTIVNPNSHSIEIVTTKWPSGLYTLRITDESLDGATENNHPINPGVDSGISAGKVGSMAVLYGVALKGSAKIMPSHYAEDGLSVMDLYLLAQKAAKEQESFAANAPAHPDKRTKATSTAQSVSPKP